MRRCEGTKERKVRGDRRANIIDDKHQSGGSPGQREQAQSKCAIEGKQNRLYEFKRLSTDTNVPVRRVDVEGRPVSSTPGDKLCNRIFQHACRRSEVGRRQKGEKEKKTTGREIPRGIVRDPPGGRRKE